MRRAHGFTFVDLLITLALMLVVTSTVALLLTHTHQLAAAQSRLTDVQQRARVLADTLGRDLRLVGAGLDSGTVTGPLHRWFSPIWPRRVGRLRADPVNVARLDAITLLYVPETTTQTTLAEADSPASGRIAITPCVGGVVPCPIIKGETLALFDAPGRVALMDVVSTSASATLVTVLGSDAGAFDTGALVAEAVIRGYYFDSAQGQLRVYDGNVSDQPVVDGITSLAFEYFGTSDPPRWPRPPSGQENCLYSESGGWRGGPVLAAVDDGLARLPVEMLADGPWCGAGGTVFDVDLLRIRRVRVVATLRGMDLAVSGPDHRVVFDIAPRNLGLGVWPEGGGAS